MNADNRKNNDGGFTLIELLVVIVIIGILVAILIPVTQDAIAKARMTKTKTNGRSVAQVLLANRLEPGPGVPPDFNSSTEYWKWFVSNGTLEVTFDFFAADGLPKCHGLDPSTFTASNNAWCVVDPKAGCFHASTPIMFTRNLKIENLNDPLEGALTDELPFGKRGVIVVRSGGSAELLREDELVAAFNPLGVNYRVLRP